jgi:DNA-binding MarR family transcriptional regulator
MVHEVPNILAQDTDVAAGTTQNIDAPDESASQPSEGAQPSPGDLASGFEEYLSSAFKLSSSLGESLSRKHSIGIGEWAILRILSQNEGLKMGQVAKLAGVSRQRLHQLVTPLAARNLVSVEASTEDKRVKTLTLGAGTPPLLQDISSDLAELGKSSTGKPEAAVKTFARSTALNNRLFKALRKESRTESASLEAESGVEPEMESSSDEAAETRTKRKLSRDVRRQRRRREKGIHAFGSEADSPNADQSLQE